MFMEILRFEIAYRFRRPLLYVFAAILLLMTFGAVSTDSVMLGGPIGNVARNASYVIVNMLIVLSTVGLLFVTIFVAPAVNRDHEGKMQELFFSTPMGRHAYLLGRYLGSTIPVILAMLLSCLGIYLASIMPWQDPDRIVPFSAWPYIYSSAVFVIPNLLVAGAIFFSIATLTRKSIYAYVGVISLFALWGIGLAFVGDLDQQSLMSIVDPFGWSTFRVMTRYWTIAERNTRILPFGGLLLLNRIIWLLIGAAAMIFTNVKYRMALAAESRKSSAPAAFNGTTPERAGRISAGPVAPPRFSLDYGRRARFNQYLRQAVIETGSILTSIPFLVILMFGAANLVASLFINPEGTASLPLTQQMLRLIEGSFELMPWLVIIIFGAELVWREKKVRISGMIDALPVPNWMPLASKVSALFAVSFIMITVAMTCTVTFQIFKGYFHFEPLLYFKGLFLIMLGELLLLSVLSIFFQVISGNRHIGTLLMVLVFVGLDVMREMGYDHRLYLYAQSPSTTYSDMNGYGPFSAGIFWYRVYWTFFAAGLAIVSSIAWMRGTDTGTATRFRLFRARLTRGNAAALAAVSILFVVTGAWIYYNTDVLNERVTRDGDRSRRALYEKQYKKFGTAAQPKVVAADLSVDIFPDSRRIEIGGSLTLMNKTESAIDTLHVNIENEVDPANLNLPGGRILLDDRDTGYRIYRLDPPLAPGDSIILGLDLTIGVRGFRNNDANLTIVRNGTFFINPDYIPIIGYSREKELQDPSKRKKYGLPESDRLPAMDDPRALQETFTSDADRIRFDAVVSTSADQIAIAPGYLEREWMENGRRHFHYKIDRPILSIYCFLSGRYEVARDEWNGIPIEVYYHKPHYRNVPRMIEGLKSSLDYFSRNFSPYPFPVIRIVEFPGYRTYAQSLASTIPYSESADFVTDLSDPDDVDMVYFITAHETGHQWFAHQVTPARVQGDEMVTESLAQYSALMVMQKDYGPDRMKKYMRYELDRYLTGRSRELKEERPLMFVENQPYIHYYKGSLVMYAMCDYIGEENFNAALRKYIAAVAYKGPPYTTSAEFLSCLEEVMPPQYEYLIEDMFKTITLYDNRALKASAVPTGDGRYRVTLSYSSRKMRSNGGGVETEVGHNDWVEIGVYGNVTAGSGADGKTLHREKHRLASGEGTIEIVVDEKPLMAGIDPRNILIDRVPGDNTIKMD